MKCAAIPNYLTYVAVVAAAVAAKGNRTQGKAIAESPTSGIRTAFAFRFLRLNK